MFKGSTAIMNLDRIELLGESIPIAVTAVNITPNDPTVYKSQTLRLTADITPNDASNKNVTWTSSDTDVATVTANGDVTGIEEGTATITVTTEDGSFTDQVTVTITESEAGTFYATRLSCSPTEKYGLAKSLSVMPGDVVNIEVYAKYIDIDGQNWTPLLNNLILSLSIPSGGIFIDGGQPGSLGNETLPFTPLNNDSEAGDAPKAYLNYIIMDRDFNPVDMGAKAVSTAAREYGQNGEHERLFFDDIVVREAGYMYIYISNEGEELVDVFFDDLRVTHTKSPVIQANDYYPYGLTFNSYQREGTTPNQYQYNGKELQDELELGVYDYGWRQYDPAIARWNRIDGLAEKYLSSSPYHYAANNPILNYDIDGNQFTPAAEKWADDLRQNIDTRMKKNVQKILDKSNLLNTGVNKRGKQLSENKANKLVRQINRMENENAGLKQTRSEINALEQSDQVYNVVTSDKFSDSNFSKAATAYNASTGQVDIILPSKAGLNLFAHEAYHAYSFEIGRMSLSAHDGNLNMLPIRNWLAYDQQDENEAYFRQGLFGSTQSSLPHEYRNRPANSTWITHISTIKNLMQMPSDVRHNTLQRIATQNGMAFRVGSVTYGPR